MECIPSELSEIITSSIDIPTIGIGAGNACDGQVLVSYDLLGMFDGFKPKFVKQYDNLSLKMENSFKQYSEDVKKNLFPDKSYSYSMDGAALDQIKNIIKKGLK